MADNGGNRRSNSGGKNWTATEREREVEGGRERGSAEKRKSVRLFSTFCQPKYSLDHTSPRSAARSPRNTSRTDRCADLGHRSEKRGRDDPILEALYLREG